MAILTTTIGAYPKPDYVPISDWFPDQDDSAALEASKGLLENWRTESYADGLENAGDEAEELFRRGAEEIIHDQVRAGIDIVTDGEVRRENYIYYQCRHMDGIDFSHLTPKSLRNDAYTAQMPTITGPIRVRETVLAHDWQVAQVFTDRPIKVTLPGPITIVDTLANTYYDDDIKLGLDLAAALNAEILALADAGCRHIQVDEPVFARKPERALKYGIEDLERCFHGVPRDVQRTVHMCCGYPKALDADDYAKADPLSYFTLADAIDDADIDAVSIEDAHRPNDLTLLERFKKTTVILGVVAVAKSHVEEAYVIKRRLKAALEHIDASRLMAAPDCGLGLLRKDLAVKKLSNLCQAAHALPA